MKLTLLIAFLIGLYASPASAQLFRLRVTSYGSADTTFQNFVDSEILKIQNDLNKDFPSAPPERMMEGMANSSVMAGKGIGSDHASNMDVFLIGAGVGVGADLAKDKTTESDLSGIGIAPGLVVGLNLGFLDTQRILGMDTNRLNVYVNYMGYNHTQPLNDKEGEESEVILDMKSFGVHFRYDWIQGNGSKLLGWGGVKLNFGYEYNKTALTFNSSINSEIDDETSDNGEVLGGTITGSPSASIVSSTQSIPIELSTSVQLLYVLSLYTGLGADYNMGQAKGKGSINGDASTINCTGGACGGGASVTVVPEANIDAKGNVLPILTRGFVGVQVNLPFLRIFVQADKAFGNDLVGATAGVRIVY